MNTTMVPLHPALTSIYEFFQVGTSTA